MSTVSLTSNMKVSNKISNSVSWQKESAPYELEWILAPVAIAESHTRFPPKKAQTSYPVYEASNTATFAPGATPPCW